MITVILLGVVMMNATKLKFVILKRHYAMYNKAECQYTDCSYAEWHYAGCHYTEWLNVESHYAECHMTLISKEYPMKDRAVTNALAYYDEKKVL
jgi:hypothetical protein